MLPDMRFTGKWRDYQQRVLDEFETHLADARIHVVAAPGSGKTILGLELARQLGRPAVILSPTRTIRDQWPARLVPLFLSTSPPAGELSFALERPGAMTTTTYQALHALWSAESGERFAGAIARLRAIGPVTLVLDEAHHLRREWWNALQALVDALPDAKLVALTATPPYDAPFAEWARYEAMCGPIDLEIGVPELVRNGDLCPHQDHVILSAPADDALELLERRRRGIAALVEEMRSDTGLLDALATHPWLTDSDAHVEAILDAPEFLSAMLVHLAASERPLPEAPLALLGVRAKDVPVPHPYWLETLLNGLLFRFRDLETIDTARAARFKSELHTHGLIEGGVVRLTESRQLFGLLAGSIAKFESIASIARAEAQTMGAALRMVILCDHVRGGELPRALAVDYRPVKLGVVPVFAMLLRASLDGQRVAILTGTLVVLPKPACGAAQAIAAAMTPPAQLRFDPLPGAPDHVRMIATGTAEGRIVELVTALFDAGEVTVLVGTQALLGEGWDAPAINSLVLASNSAAFMLSNQMRGRAIRIDPKHPEKVANIWHLATVAPAPAPEGLWADRLNWGRIGSDRPVTSDLDLLERRFRAFEGIANDGSTRIDSGLARVGLPDTVEVSAANWRTFVIAQNRPRIAAQWRQSLGEAPPRARVRETATPNYAPRGLSWFDTLHWLGASALSAGALAGADVLRGIDGFATHGMILMAMAGAAGIATLPRLAKAGWLLWRNGSIEGSLLQVTQVVLLSLFEAGLIPENEFHQASIQVSAAVNGRHDVIVHGVSRATERIVMEAIAELLGPVGNPRYLLVRRSWLGSRRRTDYHAVPAAIGRRKEWAEAFHRLWRQRVGSSRLIFTRTAEGRVQLLRARARAFSAGFLRAVDRRSTWL